MEICSKNVYMVRSLLGDVVEAHASRLWYYAPAEFTPGPALRDVFQHDVRQLEVKKLKEIT